MFGFFKKRHSATPPQILHDESNQSEVFWNEFGIGRLVPIYLQLHLASRSPQHKLVCRPDGTIDTDAVPALPIFCDENPHREKQIRADFLRLIGEQLPNNETVLSSLTAEEIVTRLSSIYTELTGKTSYGVVCRMWCTELKLLN